MNKKTGELIIKTKQGVEKERYPAVYGATLFFNEGDEVSIGDSIIEWDPFALPILTEATGRIKYEDLVVGKTVNEQADSVTGLTHKVVETKDPSYSRRFQLLMNQEMFLKFQGTSRKAVYRLPVGANIVVNDGDEIAVGFPIVKVQRNDKNKRYYRWSTESS